MGIINSDSDFLPFFIVLQTSLENKKKMYLLVPSATAFTAAVKAFKMKWVFQNNIVLRLTITIQL